MGVGTWHVPDGPALVCPHCGDADGLELNGDVEPGQIPAAVICFECGNHWTIALIDEGGDAHAAAMAANSD